MEKKTSPFTRTDWLLLAAIVGLSIQLSVMILGPAVKAWINRPQPGVQVPQQYLVEQRSGEDTFTIPINYLLYLPPKYDTDHKWPLVVYLHGAGSRGHDLEVVRRECLAGQIAQGKQFDFVLLSPQCPPDSGWSPELVVRLIEYICKSFPVDRNRVYLTGYSMGGSGTWMTASYDPTRFAAIAPLCGRGDADQAKQLKRIPVWAFHGDKDNVVPLEASQTMVDAVKKAGGGAQLTIYPNTGHGILETVYEDNKFFTWLLAQQRTGKCFPDLFEKRECRLENGNSTKYHLFVPRFLEQSVRYPMLVCPVHDGWLNEFILPETWNLKQYRFFVLKIDSPDGLDAIYQDIINSYPVDKDRIYLCGASAGGSVCWRIALQYPELVAALAPLAAGNSDVSQAAKLVNIPIWVFHNLDDTAPPCTGSMEMSEAVRRAGGNIHLTLPPASDHNCWSVAFNRYHLMEWMFAQRRGDFCWTPPGYRPWQWWHILTLPCALLVFIRVACYIKQRRRRNAVYVAALHESEATEVDFCLGPLLPACEPAGSADSLSHPFRPL